MFVDRSYKMHVHESWPSESYNTYWSSSLLSVAQLCEAFFQYTWTQPLAFLHPYLLSNPSLISASSFYFLSLLLSAILTLKTPSPLFVSFIHSFIIYSRTFHPLNLYLPLFLLSSLPLLTLFLILLRLYFLHFLLSLFYRTARDFAHLKTKWDDGAGVCSAAVRQCGRSCRRSKPPQLLAKS